MTTTRLKRRCSGEAGHWHDWFVRRIGAALVVRIATHRKNLWSTTPVPDLIRSVDRVAVASQEMEEHRVTHRCDGAAQKAANRVSQCLTRMPLH